MEHAQLVNEELGSFLSKHCGWNWTFAPIIYAMGQLKAQVLNNNMHLLCPLRGDDDFAKVVFNFETGA
jgi:hypothetical protein